MPFLKRNVDDPTGAKSAVPQFTHQTPSIRNAFIAMFLNTGGEMRVSEFLALVPKAYQPTMNLGTWERAAGAVAGRYSATAERVSIAYQNLDGTDLTAQIQAIPDGFGLEIGNRVFVVEFTNEQSSHREFDGFWAGGEVDPTAVGSQASIKVIEHDVRAIRYMTAAQLKRILPEIKQNTDRLSVIEPRVMTQAERHVLQSLQALTADLVLDTEETWVNATDGGIAALAAGDAQLTRLRANQAPTGISTWAAALTTTEPRFIVVRVPADAHLPDYRVIFGDSDPVRLNAYAVYATGSQYAYLAAPTLNQSPAGQIRLQYHGSDTHTRFIGMLAEAIMARLLPDPSGAEAGQVVQVNTALTGYVLGALAGGGLSTDQANALIQLALRDYTPHTPDRGDTLPVYIEPQGTFVLEKTSHWSDKFYPFYPVGRQIVIGGRTFNDIGTIEVALSSELTIFESADNANPAIFSATRVAGIYMRSTNRTPTEAGYQWRPKVVLDRALFPSSNGAYDYSGLSIKMRVGYEGIGQYHHASLFHSAFNRDGDDISGAGAVTEIVAGGRTYICFVPDNRNFHWRQFLANAANNNAEVSFQILKSKSASPVFPPTDPQFLSDDPATAWVDGDEFETGLYEGDANGRPVPRILPPLDAWNHVFARSNTYFSGTSPDPAAGVDGQFWANLRNGQIHQKQSGTWTGIADLVLQAELQAAIDAIEASGGADGRLIFGTSARPANTLGKVGDAYIRRLTLELGLYEKTATDTWTYRFPIDIMPSRPAFNARDGLGLFWNGNALAWSDPPVRYIKLGVNANHNVPLPTETATALPFAATLLDDNDATGFLSRHSDGNKVTLKAGSYQIDTHITLTPSNVNERSNYTIEIYQGANKLDETKYIDYVRGGNFVGPPEAIDSTHTVTLATDGDLEIRIKMSARGASQLTCATAADGKVTIRRL